MNTKRSLHFVLRCERNQNGGPNFFDYDHNFPMIWSFGLLQTEANENLPTTKNAEKRNTRTRICQNELFRKRSAFRLQIAEGDCKYQ